MAFRQPQHRPHNPRQVSFPPNADQLEVSPLPSPLRKRALEDSEEWVLFSPSQATSTVPTETASTARTPRTLALSQFSDFGSLETAARSDQVGDENEVEEEEDEDEEEDGELDGAQVEDGDNVTEHGSDPDEEAELDSLDDGLHAFHEPERLDHGGGTVLPTHDGLGSFGENSVTVQQQLWRFERPAVKRKPRRTSSVQRTLDALQEVDEITHESERTRRIEQWRLEQSRALLEEIERETRRMHRISRVGSAQSRSRADSLVHSRARSETNMSSVSTVPIAPEAKRVSVPEDSAEGERDTESFWQRFTQKVIRSLIGIDENLLSIILGEDLVHEAQPSPMAEPEPPSVDNVISLENREANVPIEETWQHRLMVRIAQELGVLVHQMSEHPGAFSTYLRTQETPTYAGLPSADTLGSSTMDATSTRQAHRSSTAFNPTLRTQQQSKAKSEASLWGIEEEGDELELVAARDPHVPTEADRQRAEQEYWERELDVKMVFNFLKNRFSSPPQSPTIEAPPPVVSPSEQNNRRQSVLSAISVPNSARRAALIRQQHPLTSRNPDPSLRRRSVMSQPAAITVAGHLGPSRTSHRVGKTSASSSCASQSTKKSKRSGSSRNYWDHAASVGSGPAGIGGVGAWGEVAL